MSTQQIAVLPSFGLASAAACTAELATLPMVTAKVRLQLQQAGPDGSLKYRGLLGTIIRVELRNKVGHIH